MKKIALSGKLGSGKFALVDDEDYPLLSRISWAYVPTGYAFHSKCLGMHALILGYPYVNHLHHIDHIDHDRLNNQKRNLRVVTIQQNKFHSRKLTPGKYTNFKGLCWVPKNTRRPWVVAIAKTVDGVQKTYKVGCFAAQEEAARAYDAKAKELFGEFAVLNFPEDVTKKTHAS